MFLENSEIKLRAVEPEDLELLYKWENATELWIHGNTLSPYSKLALREYINITQQYDIYHSKQLRMMIDLVDGNIPIGTIDLYDFDIRNSRAGIGVLIDKPYRNKHYASQALELMKRYAFDFLRIHQLYAYISVSNHSSLKVFENGGYIPVGTLKDWVQEKDKFEDVLVVQLINPKE